MSRAAIAILSTENLIHNVALIKQLAPKSGIIAMIKANGYGHGLRSTAQRLEKHVFSLGVASVDEAMALRSIGIKAPITLMEGVFAPDDLLIASCQNFHVVFHDNSQIKWLLDSKLPKPIFAWLKVETGMNRLGLNSKDIGSIYSELTINPNIVQPIGVMSHFACADEKTHPLNKIQISNFQKVIKNLPGLKSLSNSPAIFNFPECNYDVVRPGISLYGISPINNKSAKQLGLKPVMTLQTRLIAIKKLSKNSYVGYGGRFVSPESMSIGIIAMGYGDGYPRTIKDGVPVLVNNIRCQMVGSVSMDMATIDLRNCPDAKIGDPVTLWGGELPIEEVASFTKHLTYDLVCAIQNRVKFHWTMNF